MGNACNLSNSNSVEIESLDTDSKVVRIGIEEVQYCLKIPICHNEIVALRSCWEVAKTKWPDICRMAFKSWFNTYPELLSIFGFYSPNLTIDEMMASDCLMLHVDKMEQVVSEILSKLEDKTELTIYLIDLGKIHHKFGATQKYANAVGNNFLNAIGNLFPDLDTLTKNGWDSLFKYIVGNLKLGMRIEDGKFIKNKTCAMSKLFSAKLIKQ